MDVWMDGWFGKDKLVDRLVDGWTGVERRGKRCVDLSDFLSVDQVGISPPVNNKKHGDLPTRGQNASTIC